MCNDVQEFNRARKQTRQHLVVDEAAENVVFVTGRKREEIAPLAVDKNVSLCRPWLRAACVTYA